MRSLVSYGDGRNQIIIPKNGRCKAVTVPSVLSENLEKEIKL